MQCPSLQTTPHINQKKSTKEERLNTGYSERLFEFTLVTVMLTDKSLIAKFKIFCINYFLVFEPLFLQQ